MKKYKLIAEKQAEYIEHLKSPTPTIESYAAWIKKNNVFQTELSELESQEVKEKEPDLLLDGSEMPEKEFYKKFEQIVGCSFRVWAAKETTKKDGGGEWYDYKDGTFTLGGTAYAPPKLYGKIESQEVEGVTDADIEKEIRKRITEESMRGYNKSFAVSMAVWVREQYAQ